MCKVALKGLTMWYTDNNNNTTQHTKKQDIVDDARQNQLESKTQDKDDGGEVWSDLCWRVRVII